MKLEDRLRDELHARVEHINPDLSAWSATHARGTRRRRQRTRRVAALSAIAILVVIGGIVYAVGGSGSGRIETGTHRQPATPQVTDAATGGTALPTFQNTDDEFNAAVSRLTPRITYPGIAQTESRGYLGAEWVFCDVSAAVPTGSGTYGRPAFTFPLGEPLTDQRITDGCLGSDVLNSTGSADQVRAGTHEVCQTTQRPAPMVAVDTPGRRRVEKVVKPLVVFGATCAQKGYEPSGPGLLDEVNHRRRAEIFMRAVPVDCPTEDATAAWVRAVSTDMLGRSFLTRPSPNPSLPADGCSWPVQFDFDKGIAYVG